MIYKILCFVLILFTSSYQILFAQETSEYYNAIAKQDSIAHTKHIHPLPSGCSKILVYGDTSTDSLVVALYGKGLFDENDGHGGARYYIDPGKTVILKTEIGTDFYIEACEITLVEFPFDFVEGKIDSVPVANNLSTNPQILKDIQFRDSPDKIIKAFGVPNQEISERRMNQLIYTDDIELWDEVLYYSVDFVFLNNQLVRIAIYNGD